MNSDFLSGVWGENTFLCENMHTENFLTYDTLISGQHSLQQLQCNE